MRQSAKNQQMETVSIKHTTDHIRLINYGVDLLNANKEDIALPYFEKAYALAPECPSAIYNLANCYYHLAKESKAITLFNKLLSFDNSDRKHACPDDGIHGEEYKLDALFGLFRATLFLTESWDVAYPYAVQFLDLRRKGGQSVFTFEEVNEWIAYYKGEFENSV